MFFEVELNLMLLQEPFHYASTCSFYPRVINRIVTDNSNVIIDDSTKQQNKTGATFSKHPLCPPLHFIPTTW